MSSINTPQNSPIYTNYNLENQNKLTPSRISKINVIKTIAAIALVAFWNPLGIDYKATSNEVFTVMGFDMTIKPSVELLLFQKSLNNLTCNSSDFIPDLPNNLKPEQLSFLNFTSLPDNYLNDFFEENPSSIKHFNPTELQTTFEKGTLTKLSIQEDLPARLLSIKQLQELKISKFKKGQLDLLFPQTWIDDKILKQHYYSNKNHTYWNITAAKYLNEIDIGKKLFSYLNIDDVKQAFKIDIIESHHFPLLSQEQIKAVSSITDFNKLSSGINYIAELQNELKFPN